MSDEPAKDVSPLRLKRPGAKAPPPTPSSGLPVPPPPAEAVAAPAPDLPSPSGTSPASPALRRRPSIAQNQTDTHPQTVGEAPIHSEPPLPALAPLPPVSQVDAAPSLKLRVNAKSASTTSSPAPELPENLFPGDGDTNAPLVPLPGFPAFSGASVLPPHAPLPPFPSFQPPSTPPPFPDGTPSTGLPPLPLGAPIGTRHSLQGGGKVAVPPALPKLKVGKSGQKKRTAPRRDLLIALLGFAAIVSLGGAAYFFLAGDAATDENPGNLAHLPKGAEGPPLKPNSAEPTVPISAETPNPNVTPQATVVETTPAPADTSTAHPSTDEKSPDLATTVLTPRPTPTPPPAPSTRFVRYAEALVISGVYEGEPPRALIDGRIIRLGELIEPAIGVTFTGVDSVRKQIILQEPNGAIFRVSYW